MQISFELTGRVQEDAERKSRNFRTALYRGMKRRGDNLKERLRADVANSGIKNAARVSKTWSGEIYPRKSNGTPRPAYQVSNRAPWIIESLERGASIQAKDGALIIPIGRARTFKLPPFTSRAALIQKMRAIYGELTLVKSKRAGEFMLGATVAGAKGKARFMPLFILRRQVKAPDLLSATQIIDRATRRFPDEYAFEVKTIYEQLEAAAQ